MKTEKHRFPYQWTLKDAVFTKDKGKVFSCFACGGGSTMGYKLAGFDVIGCNEIDPKMMEAYTTNHNPKYSFLEGIQTFKLRDDLPEELYNLDILDGSPPCSSFSMAGNRGDDWGKEKKFREGQAEQVLDTLFFDFIDLAKKLQPKVVVAENVKGLLLGDAINYVKRIYKEFDEAGYYCQHWLLDASKMGVPQRRERVFFVCLRKDLAQPFLEQVDFFTQLPKLKLEFNEDSILFKDFYIKNSENDRMLTGQEALRLWNLRLPEDSDMSNAAQREGNRKFWNNKYLKLENTPYTFTTNEDACVLFDEPRKPNKYEVCCIGTFPQDYNFKTNKYAYIVGMSVPPIMTAQISTEIYNQWILKINNLNN
jgi:DNA (cytosine-5)-methyltransferase 1